MDKDCKYCSLVQTVLSPVIDTDHWIVFVSFSQKYLGRCVVLSREHRETLSDLGEEQWLDFASIVKTFERAAKKVFGANMFNWTCLMNDAYKREVAKAHVHWHVRPRYKKPVEFAGITFVDEAFGHHYDRVEPEKASDELMGMIADRLRSGIEARP